MTLAEATKCGLQLQVNAKTDGKARQYNGTDTILYSKVEVNNMKQILRKEGVLSLVVKEIPHLSRALAWEADGTGKFDYNVAKHVSTMQLLMQNFLSWARSGKAPSKLVKHGEAVERTVVQGTSTGRLNSKKVNTSSKGGSKGRNLGPKGSLEYYRQGSCIRLIADRLATQKQMTLEELFKKLPFSGNHMPQLKRIIKHGKRFGNWEIYLNGENVRMEIKK
jgi:hypothetical protein